MFASRTLDDCKPLHLQGQRDALIAQRTELAHQNTLRERIAGFSAQVGAAADDLDFEQRQKLLRLVVEHVFVRGWRVEIQLRIPLDEPPTPPDRGMSSNDCLRSLGNARRRKLSTQGSQGALRQTLQSPLAPRSPVPREEPRHERPPTPLIAFPHDLSDEAPRTCSRSSSSSPTSSRATTPTNSTDTTIAPTPGKPISGQRPTPRSESSSAPVISAPAYRCSPFSRAFTQPPTRARQLHDEVMSGGNQHTYIRAIHRRESCPPRPESSPLKEATSRNATPT